MGGQGSNSSPAVMGADGLDVRCVIPAHSEVRSARGNPPLLCCLCAEGAGWGQRTSVPHTSLRVDRSTACPHLEQVLNG